MVFAIPARRDEMCVAHQGKVVAEEPLFAELNARIREVRQAPDGSIYIITDGPDGAVVQVTPKS